MPVYNGERHIREAIESILNQTYRNIEFIIVDDGSTDNSAAIILSYKDTRIKYYKNKQNLRIVKTLNRAIECSSGDFVARMDADDIARPARIEKQVSYLIAHPEVSLVDTVMEYMDEDGVSLHKINNHITKETDILKTMRETNCLGHSSIMTRISIYQQYKYRQIDYEDYDLWLRLINDGKIIHKLDEPLLLYRTHSASITGQALIANKHFYKLGISMMFYYRHLSANDKLKSYNLHVLINAQKALLMWIWKMRNKRQ